MWIQMGKTWAGMFNLLEDSLMPDDDADCSAISAADVADHPPKTASYLKVRIPTAMVIK